MGVASGKVGGMAAGGISTKHNAAFIAVCAVFSASVGLPAVCWLGVPRSGGGAVSRGGVDSVFAGVYVIARGDRMVGASMDNWYVVGGLERIVTESRGKVWEAVCTRDLGGNVTCTGGVVGGVTANGASTSRGNSSHRDVGVVRFRYDDCTSSYTDDRFGRLRYAAMMGTCHRRRTADQSTLAANLSHSAVYKNVGQSTATAVVGGGSPVARVKIVQSAMTTRQIIDVGTRRTSEQEEEEDEEKEVDQSVIAELRFVAMDKSGERSKPWPETCVTPQLEWDPMLGSC